MDTKKVRRIYEEGETERWSLFLFVISVVVDYLRKISIYENIKAYYYPNKEIVPAVFLEKYLLVFWVLTPSALFFLPSFSKHLSLLVVLLCLLQIIQTNLYHEFLRPAFRRMHNLPNGVAHNRLRSFTISIFNYCAVTVLFGYAYWIVGDGFKADAMKKLGNCIYFSFTYAWSAGSQSVAPGDLRWTVKALIIVQIVTTLFIVAALLSTAIASLRPAEERERSTITDDTQ
jgi:hypothetical protein